MATLEHLTTATDLLQMPGLGRCELIRGELIMMAPAGLEHGRIVGNVTWILKDFLRQHSLGILTGAETGFWIGHAPDTVRAPNVAFVQSSRVPPKPTQGFFDGAPDLAVEVLSPNDRAGEVLAKVQGWLAAGCRAVWVIDPEMKTVSIYDGRGQMTVLGLSDTLLGNDVLPEFQVSVGEVFA